MMNASNDISRLVEELAAYWTEPALHILKGAGVRKISVDMELEIWHTLKEMLGAELRWQRVFRSATLGSLSTLMEQTLREAALLIARKFEPESASHDFEHQVSRSAYERRSTAAERALYSAIVRRPMLRVAFKEPSRTDFTPRLHALAGSS
jgi:hypothetical protein